jgi:hypothetical protein
MIAGSDRAFSMRPGSDSPNDEPRLGRYGKAAGFACPGGFVVRVSGVMRGGAGYAGKSILYDGGRFVVVGLGLFAEFYHCSF